MSEKTRVRIWRIVFSRFLITAVLLILQIWLLFFFYGWLKEYSHLATIFTTGIGIILIIYMVNSTNASTYKTTWILILAVFPVFGTFLYLYMRTNIGATRPRKILGEILDETKKYSVTDKEIRKRIENENPYFGRLAAYIEKYGGYPAWTDTKLNYYPFGEDALEPILTAIREAKQFIFLEFFIVEIGKFWNSILDLLEEKVKEGVEVRVLYDDMGCIVTLPRNYYNELRRRGINSRAYAEVLPLLSTHYNNRDHRKILVVDNKVGFTGGINLADEYINEISRFGKWKDNMMRLEGKGVNNLTLMFLQMWNSVYVQYRSPEMYMRYLCQPDNGIEENEVKQVEAKEYSSDEDVSAQVEKVQDIVEKVMPKPEVVESLQPKAIEGSTEVSEKEYEEQGIVIPYGDGPHHKENLAENVYMDIISHASNYVYIMTPYLMLSDEMTHCICYAAKSGVDVRLILPHIPDKKIIFTITRSQYRKLMAAGVGIYEYTPGFVHGKLVLADGAVGVVGTINFDFRSLFLHYECGCLIYKNQELRKIKEDFEKSFEESQKMDWESYKKIPVAQRLCGWVLNLFAPLL